MKKILMLVIVALNISACAGSAIDLTKPVTLNTNPPEGPFEYKKGWSDGCRSGIAATNTAVYMTFGVNQYTLDTDLRYNKLYNTAWRYAYNHCGYSMKSMAQYSL
jgi:hypothetical protein